MDKINELKRKAAAIHKEHMGLLNTIADRDGKMTGEEREQSEKMVADLRSISETVSALEAAEKRAADYATNNAPAPTDEPEERTAPTGRPSDPTFENFGDFTRAAVNREERVMQMGVGSAGGVLVPDQYATAVLGVEGESEIVGPYATEAMGAGDGAPDAAVEVPTWNQGSNGAFAGAAVVHLAEGGTKTSTEVAFKSVRLEPEELAAYVVLTDKMLRNAPQISTLLEGMLGGALSEQIDVDRISGNGVGKSLGYQNAGCKLTVTRDTASNFKFADVAAMLAAAMPDSWDKLQWVANQTVLPKIIAMADAAGNSIFIAGDVTKGIRPSLLGIPVRFTGRVPVLGTAGDVSLCDFSKYLKRDGSGPFIAKSEHVYFTKNQTVVKIFMNTDGRPWMDAPLTLNDASTQVSPFVLLS